MNILSYYSLVISQIFDPAFVLFILKMCFALLLGLLIGLERIHSHKTAGMRTYALVAVAAAFFVTIADSFAKSFGADVTTADAVLRMASQIVTGIGFLGAGLIIFKDGHIENLTTAAGMWVCAGIGMAVGFGMFREALFVTILAFIVLGILSIVERYVRLHIFPDPGFEKIIAVEKPKRTRKKKVE